MKHIVIIVDNSNWCWTNSMKAVKSNIYNYKITIIPAGLYSKFSKTIKYDMVYGRGYAFDFAEYIPRKTPWAYTVGTGGTMLQQRILECFRAASLPGCRGVVVQNKFAMTALNGLHPGRVWLIPNGVDVNKFHPRPNHWRRHVVGMAANIHGPRASLKGVDLVQGACDRLGVELRIIDNKDARLDHDEVPGWLRRLTIYAQPSEAEGCSNSVMEAMSCGLPVLICRGVGYHGEKCTDKQVVFVERTVDSIAAAIDRLISDSGYRMGIAGRARMFAMNHRWERIALKYKRMFDSILNTTRRKSC